MAAATAGRTWDASSTVDSTGIALFKSEKYTAANGGTSNGSQFKCVRFTVDAASAVALQVQVKYLHGASYYYTVPIGGTQDFVTIGESDSRTAMGDYIYARGASGTATFSGGIVA